MQVSYLLEWFRLLNSLGQSETLSNVVMILRTRKTYGKWASSHRGFCLLPII